MATPRGRKSPNLINRLTNEPYDFSFVQAIRLLERYALGRSLEAGSNSKRPKAIGGHNHPREECITFKTETSLLYPASDIGRLKKTTKESFDTGNHDTWEMTVNFMGLYGPSGVLPHHYSELILQRVKFKDESMRDFLDMLNHRVVSQFYRASIKYLMIRSFERSQLIRQQSSSKSLASAVHNQSQALLALAGLGDRSQQNRMGLEDSSIISASGFLQQQVRSVKNLEKLIKFQFGIDATIEQFKGEWHKLQPDFRTKLSSDPWEGENNILGQNAILGKRVWQAQGKFSVLLKPNNLDEFMEIAPDSDRLKAMENIIHFYVGIELDFDFKIRLRSDQLPRTQLKPPKARTFASKESSSEDHKNIDQEVRLGWSCKLASKPVVKKTDEDVLTENSNKTKYTIIRVTRRAMHHKDQNPELHNIVKQY